MTTDSLRVLGYLRRSTDKQAMSPETQARRLRDAAHVFGWDLTIREEDAASAQIPRRSLRSHRAAHSGGLPLTVKSLGSQVSRP